MAKKSFVDWLYTTAPGRVTIFFASSHQKAYNSFTSGKIWKGLVGSPPKFLIVLM